MQMLQDRSHLSFVECYFLLLFFSTILGVNPPGGNNPPKRFNPPEGLKPFPGEGWGLKSSQALQASLGNSVLDIQLYPGTSRHTHAYLHTTKKIGNLKNLVILLLDEV